MGKKEAKNIFEKVNPKHPDKIADRISDALAAGVGNCEMCESEGQNLYQGVLKDEYGTRYRKVCRYCWQKYNFKER